ncbi:MAG: hypothetical protein R3B70_21350 [Polyangiaceae bacterium]
MRAPSPFAPRLLTVALFALGLTAAATAAGCKAELETVCYGPCEGTGGSHADTGTTDSAGGGGSGGTGGAMCSADPESGDFPCDVHAVLVAKCQTCHAETHVSGAPIDLLACSRFHEPDCGGVKTRFETARTYVAANFMPNAGQTLTAEEKKTLLDWLDACAPCEPEASTGCGAPPGPKACYEK